MKVSFVINIINLISFVENFDACKMGCGSQDTAGLPADFLCVDQQEETMMAVQQPGNDAQCKAVRFNRRGRCRFHNRISIEDNQAVFVSSTEGARFYRIFSPGFDSESCYSDNFVCAYEVKCGIDQTLYYHITVHDVESPANKVCFDELRVERESRRGEFHKSCGRVGTGMLDFDDLPVAVSGVRSRNSSMLVTFFSGTTCTASGYYMFANCVNVSRQDTPQCFDNTTETRKRQISDRFDERFPFLSHSLAARNFEIRVGEKFTYSSNTIRSGLNLFTLDKIWALVVFHRENGRLVYYRGTSETFFGYGILRARNGLALYIDYDAPPRFHPTEDQEIYLRNILSILTFQYPGEDYVIVDLDSTNGTQPTESPVTPTRILPTIPLPTTDGNATQPIPLPTNPAPDPPRLLQNQVSGLQSLQELCAESVIRANSCNAIVRESAELFLNTNCLSI